MSDLLNFVEYWDAVMHYVFKNLMGWTKATDSTARVAVGGLTLNPPASGYQIYKQFNTKVGAVNAIPVTSALNGTFLINFWCLITGTTDCYDNVWADLTLKGGNPGSSSIFGLYDLYTWSGWSELFLFYLFISAWAALWSFVGGIVYVITYWSFTSLPLC